MKVLAALAVPLGIRPLIASGEVLSLAIRARLQSAAHIPL